MLGGLPGVLCVRADDLSNWLDLFFCSRFQGAPIIPVAAKPGGPEASETEAPQGISELIEVLSA